MKRLLLLILIFSSCVKKNPYICTDTTKYTTYINSDTAQVKYDVGSYSRNMTKREKDKYVKDGHSYYEQVNDTGKVLWSKETTIICE